MGANLEDIARICGVSTATVSRAINNPDMVKPETRDLILKYIKQYHYVPNAIARSLSRKETNTVGVAIPDILNPFFGSIIRGISTILRKNDYNIILFDTEETKKYEFEALNTMLEERVRGIFITTSLDDEKSEDYVIPDLLQQSQQNIPVVFIDREPAYPYYNGVYFDNINAGVQATDCLIKNGHKKIALILGPEFSSTNKERFKGYSQALTKNGLSVNPNYIFHADRYTAKNGYEITKRILALDDRPTAIFAGSNSLTTGCITCLISNGIRIPQDMALIGFDDTKNYDPFGLHISYIERSVSLMGEHAAKLLLKQLEMSKDNPLIKKRVTLPSKLILKGSEVYFS
jgi:LacI family transcriptional regulator